MIDKHPLESSPSIEEKERGLAWLAGKMKCFGIRSFRPEYLTLDWLSDRTYRSCPFVLTSLVFCLLGTVFGLAAFNGAIAHFNSSSQLEAWGVVVRRYRTPAMCIALFIGILINLISYRRIQTVLSWVVGSVFGVLLGIAFLSRYGALAIPCGLLLGLIVGVTYWLILGKFTTRSGKIVELDFSKLEGPLHIVENLLRSILPLLLLSITLTLIAYFTFAYFFVGVKIETAWQALFEPDSIPARQYLLIETRALTLSFGLGLTISLSLTGAIVGIQFSLESRFFHEIRQQTSRRQILYVFLVVSLLSSIPLGITTNWLFGLAIGALLGLFIANLSGGRLVLERSLLIHLVTPMSEKIKISDLLEYAIAKEYVKEDHIGQYEFTSVYRRKYYEHLFEKRQDEP